MLGRLAELLRGAVSGIATSHTGKRHRITVLRRARAIAIDRALGAARPTRHAVGTLVRALAIIVRNAGHAEAVVAIADQGALTAILIGVDVDRAASDALMTPAVADATAVAAVAGGAARAAMKHGVAAQRRGAAAQTIAVAQALDARARVRGTDQTVWRAVVAGKNGRGGARLAVGGARAGRSGSRGHVEFEPAVARGLSEREREREHLPSPSAHGSPAIAAMSPRAKPFGNRAR
jgi:hypothetical protein